MFDLSRFSTAEQVREYIKRKSTAQPQEAHSKRAGGNVIDLQQYRMNRAPNASKRVVKYQH